MAGVITLNVDGKEIFKIESTGDVTIEGKNVGIDKKMYFKFVAFLKDCVLGEEQKATP